MTARPQTGWSGGYRPPLSAALSPSQPANDNPATPGAPSPDRHPIPALAMKESSNATYMPPSLPEYLKSVHDLKPIVGAPKDDEVRGIHAVLRMAHSATHIPGIFDPELSMNLAQHLFEVQLARHRERYPFGLFPQDVIYTPPTLPSHVAVDLKPVHGIPSDEELQGVHAAVRAYEHVSNVPSLFDPKVEMELSQHLFNIQLARYMNRVPPRVPKPEPVSRPEDPRRPRVSIPVDPASDTSDDEGPDTPDGIGPDDPVVSSRAELTNGDKIGQLVGDDSNKLLERLVDAMEAIKSTLIHTEQSRARVIRRARNNNFTNDELLWHEVMNEMGELPRSQGLPELGLDGQPSSYSRVLTEEQLARYLQFYGIGHDLIELGDTPAIKNGGRGKAEALLSKYAQ